MIYVASGVSDVVESVIDRRVPGVLLYWPSSERGILLLCLVGIIGLPGKRSRLVQRACTGMHVHAARALHQGIYIILFQVAWRARVFGRGVPKY